MLPLQTLFIDGRRVAASSGATFATINPTNGREICRVQCAGEADVERAVAAAAKGFAIWSAMTGTERGRILNRAARLLRERNRELAELEVLDTGKPIQEAETVDVASGADCLEYFAGQAPCIAGQYIGLRNAFVYTRREPLGICAGIGAWNYPIQIACWKSAPALACGNAMIFKPAELTPLTALRLAEIYAEAVCRPASSTSSRATARSAAC
jgi:betaine-aldehyde dehydrogenase